MHFEFVFSDGVVNQIRRCTHRTLPMESISQMPYKIIFKSLKGKKNKQKLKGKRVTL